MTIAGIHGSTAAEISDITLDSRQVKAGSMFAAIKGTVTDGHQYIAKALELGAAAILCGAATR